MEIDKWPTNIRKTLQQTSFLKILSAKLLTFEIASAGKDAKTFKLQQGTIHLRRRQMFTIFDPYPPPSAIFYYYLSANLANF